MAVDFGLSCFFMEEEQLKNLVGSEQGGRELVHLDTGVVFACHPRNDGTPKSLNSPRAHACRCVLCRP